MGLITSIEYLQPAIQERIKSGIQEQIIGRALLEKELNPDTYLNYLNSEIAKASEAISKLLDESKREGADLDNISMAMVWNKERKTALLRLKDLVSQEPATGRELPSELDTEQAREYFARAVAAGLMSEQYKWLASQSLLACFCREMSVNLDLGKGYSSEGQKRLSWKPFEALFNVKAKNLTTSLNDIKKTGQDPIGIEKVEAIFKD